MFVLREVFETPYDEIAEAVGKTPAAVRQIAHRAREHVAARRPRMQVSRGRAARRSVERFLAALSRGDMQGLLDVLAPDVVLVADGGGVVAAARHPIEGADRVVAIPVRLRQDRAGAPTSGSCGSTGRPRCGSTSTASSTPRSAW